MRKMRRGWRMNSSICTHAGSTVAEHIWVDAWLPINNLTHNELKMPSASVTVLCIPTYVAVHLCVHVPTVICQHISCFTRHMSAHPWWTSGPCTRRPLGQLPDDFWWSSYAGWSTFSLTCHQWRLKNTQPKKAEWRVEPLKVIPLTFTRGFKHSPLEYFLILN